MLPLAVWCVPDAEALHLGSSLAGARDAPIRQVVPPKMMIELLGPMPHRCCILLELGRDRGLSV
jgi:hypothetical protein